MSARRIPRRVGMLSKSSYEKFDTPSYCTIFQLFIYVRLMLGDRQFELESCAHLRKLTKCTC